MKQWFLSSWLFVLAAAPASAATADERPFAIGPSVAMYKGDALRSSIAGSLGATWAISPAFALMADFTAGAVQTDRPISADLKNGDLMMIADTGLLFVIPVTMGKGEAAWRARLYGSLGPAVLWLGDTTSWAGFLGGGMDIFPGPAWLGIHFDMKTYMYALNNPNGSDYISDIVFQVGPLFLF